MSEIKIRKNGAYLHAIVDGKHVFDFPGIGKFSVEPEKASAEARHFLLNYGVKQWVQDGGAVSAGADGKTDPNEKYNGMFARAELLNSGAVDLRRPSTGGGGAISYVTRALVALKEYQGQDVSTFDKANAFVKTVADKKPEFKGQIGKARAWLETKSTLIKAEIEKIRLAEAVPEVDPDEDLKDLFN